MPDHWRFALINYSASIGLLRTPLVHVEAPGHRGQSAELLRFAYLEDAASFSPTLAKFDIILATKIEKNINYNLNTRKILKSLFIFCTDQEGTRRLLYGKQTGPRQRSAIFVNTRLFPVIDIEKPVKQKTPSLKVSFYGRNRQKIISGR